MTSYLDERETEIVQNIATSILLKFLTLGWDISRTICRIEVSEVSVELISLHFSRSFIWAQLISRPEFPFNEKLLSNFHCIKAH